MPLERVFCSRPSAGRDKSQLTHDSEERVASCAARFYFMKKLLITGGVGTGKSAFMKFVGPVLRHRLTAFSADQAVQKLYQVSSFKNSLANLFGDRVLILKNEGGELEVDRAWLRDHVLPFPEARRALEGCVPGRVLEMLEVTCDCARNAGEKVFVAEVPLHYEIGQVISADLVIVVAASRSVQVRRMMENRGLDEATAQAFLNAQWPIEAKVEKADVVIWNDGDPSALECQTLLLANLLNLE